MYIIVIAWLYVALLVAVANTTVVGGVLTFLFGGIGPLALFIYIFGTPARRRAARALEGQHGANDRLDPEQPQ